MYYNNIQSDKSIKTLFVFVLMMMLIMIIPSHTDAQSHTESMERARAVGIDESRLEQIEQRATARGMTTEQLARILEPAIAMAGENLPYELIFEKAFEGISKGIPADRIQPVLASIAGSSSQAAGFTDSWVQRPEVRQMIANRGGMDSGQFRNEMIRAGSKGLMQNFDREVLEQTLELVATGPALDRSTPAGIIMAISILSDLPTAAQEPSATARMVVSALEGGFGTEELQKLPGAMNMAQRRSRLPAQAVAEGLRRQLEGGFPASQILQNLFNDEMGGGPPGNIPAGLNPNNPANGLGFIKS